MEKEEALKAELEQLQLEHKQQQNDDVTDANDKPSTPAVAVDERTRSVVTRSLLRHRAPAADATSLAVVGSNQLLTSSGRTQSNGGAVGSSYFKLYLDLSSSSTNVGAHGDVSVRNSPFRSYDVTGVDSQRAPTSTGVKPIKIDIARHRTALTSSSRNAAKIVTSPRAELSLLPVRAGARGRTSGVRRDVTFERLIALSSNATPASVTSKVM